MKKQKLNKTRRSFIKKCSFSAVPFLISPISTTAETSPNTNINQDTLTLNFTHDGLGFSPQEYIQKLTEINDTNTIKADFYGKGGTTDLLEKEFAKITGKEKAIYLPSGTMANQLAIKLLNGEKTKVIVPENSHIFRDEADAAQSVHNKRLVPVVLETTKPFFELSDLKNTIDYLNKNEVFKSGIGTVAIENPIRRADGISVPIEVIKKLSAYCRENGYKLHLDGARIHIASAYTNISISEYASYFDTIYISLYKYLNATGGAILCGDAEVIDQVSHQIKIHGGSGFQNWGNTSVALHYLEGIEKRWKDLLISAQKLISELNKIDGVVISKIKNGTNIYDLKLSKNINLKTLASILYNEENIWLGSANEDGIVKFTINESLHTRSIQEVVDTFKNGIEKSRK